MRSHSERLAVICCDAADKVADEECFVPVRKLVELLGAELRAQPLLYEGLVAEPKTKDAKWLVMVDSLSSGYESAKYETERSANALPPRVRFTIAHELGHILQLRSSEPSSNLKHSRTPLAAEMERELEREADTLSPLLLIPNSGFARLFTDSKDRLHLARLVEAKKHWAVSREVLVNRLGLLTKFDPKGFRFKPALQDLAVGIGQWTTPRAARVLDWPRPFCNFSENLVPDFLQKNRINEPLNTIFKNPDFVLNGGNLYADEADIFLGTPSNPQAEKSKAVLSMETTKPVTGGKFLFTVSRSS